jgi:hypothetical protein
MASYSVPHVAGGRAGQMTDKIARNVRTEELTNKDKRIIAQLLCHKADARSWTIFEDFDFIRVSVDYGKPNESEPSLLVDNIAVTPEIFTALGQVAARWQVQSVDVDDRLDELLSMDEALISAATRAFERRIREKNLCELDLTVTQIADNHSPRGLTYFTASRFQV